MVEQDESEVKVWWNRTFI